MRKMNSSDGLDLGVFVEQAEYISPEDFAKWTVSHPQEKSILKKLVSSGAKLITGPRGSGKTTLMLKALHSVAESDVLAIYVNFKTSLKLEPLYKRRVSAPYWFSQWLILKVYEGLYGQVASLGCGEDFQLKRDEVKRIIRDIENGEIDRVEEARQKNIDSLQADIELILNLLGRTRCVLLLDDAAHAFSKEQQEDFFEFFRKVKTRAISPKAAIYPGVTAFSPSFHVGHDAEEIDIWINPKGENYLGFMSSLLKSRLPETVYARLEGNQTLLYLIIFSANGMPRYMLNMIGIIATGDELGDSEVEFVDFKYDRKVVLDAVSRCYKSTRSVYDSLGGKLPIYKAFISKGGEFFDSLMQILKDFNKGKGIQEQTVVVAIKRPLEDEIIKVLGFLQYAGLVVPVGDSIRGSKGVYDLFAIHNSAIVVRNAFFSRRAINLQDYVGAFEVRAAHNYPRVTTATILGVQDISSQFSLSLPPCQSCQTPRVNEAARFCTNCGAELTSISVFENIVDQDIDVLPLTDRRIEMIKEHSKIRKIKDILMDHDRRQLRGVPRIGPFWANKIAHYAEEQIA